MKIRQLLWLLPLFAVMGYIACRKMDSQHTDEQPQQSAKENRFFNEHTSTNPQVQVIAGYLQRLNGKNGFAEKAIEKVGYPRWDKAIIVDKKTNTLIESEDSVVITHIPFVRDSQNYVNASLVVRTTPSDTTLNYVCDWQYAQMPYGVPDTDSSAENYAKYFMFFSKRTTGQSAFLITDTFLFSSSPRMHSADRLKLTILDNNATAGMPETNSVLICYPVVHCGSPQWCAEHGGCDYQNCVQPGTCYLFYDCVSFYSGGSSGGGSGGGPTGGDPGGGTGGGGTGSGGSGSGVPPDCQGPTPARPGFIETNFTCTPGWVPMPDDESNNSTLIANLKKWDDSIIINPTVRPCIDEIIDSIRAIKEGTIAEMIYLLSYQLPPFNWEIREVPVLPPPYTAATAATSIFLQNPFATTDLNRSVLENATNVCIARTILHEAIHAFIQNYIAYNNILPQATKDSIMSLSFAGKLKSYFRVRYPDRNNTAHNLMAVDFKDDIKYCLKLLCPKFGIILPPNDLELFCDDMSWGGLQDDADSSPWMDPTYLSDADRARILKRLDIELNNLPGFAGQVAIGGTSYYIDLTKIGQKACQ